MAESSSAPGAGQEELEGDVDMGDLNEWLVLDDVNSSGSEAKKQVGKPLPQKKMSTTAASKPVSDTNLQPVKQSPKPQGEDVIVSDKKSEGSSVPETKAAAKPVKAQPDTKSAPKNVLSDIGDIAGLIDTIDSPQNVQAVKKISAKKTSRGPQSKKKEQDKVQKAVQNKGKMGRAAPEKTTVSTREQGKKRALESQGQSKEDSSIEETSKPKSAKNEINNGKNSESGQAGKKKDQAFKESKPQEGGEKESVPPSDSINSSVQQAESGDSAKESDQKEKDSTGSSKQSNNDAAANEPAFSEQISEDIAVTEEEMKGIDNYMSELLLKSLDRVPEPPKGGNDIKMKVQVGPMELADLAEPSVQELMNVRSTLSFCFKKQVNKFKKKKGYAEIILYKPAQLPRFLKDLINTRFLSKELEITYFATHGKFEKFKGSFKINTSKADRLIKAIKAGEVPMKGKEGKDTTSKKFIAVGNIPPYIKFPYFKMLFPFSKYCNFTEFNQETKKTSSTAKVFYADFLWRDGVLDCCSDFTYNGQLLTAGRESDLEASKEGIPQSKPDEMETQEIAEEGNEETSMEDRSLGDEFEAAQSAEVGSMDNDASAGVANMTRDVCTTMMESLDKLKQLDTDDPDVNTILEMQAQLARLQESLLKKQKSSEEESSSSSTKGVTPSESVPVASSSVKGHAKKEKVTDMDLAEQILEAQDMKVQQQRDKLQQLQEEERREREAKRKSTWAKKLIEESKEGWSVVKEVKSKNLNEDAQKLLQMREEKLAREEEERRQKEEEEKERKKEELLKAQQKLREDLERAAQRQKESSETSGPWDPKAILRQFQETFSSLSESLPENAGGSEQGSEGASNDEGLVRAFADSESI